MMKKTLALTLTALTLCMVLSGCSDSTAGSTAESKTAVLEI